MRACVYCNSTPGSIGAQLLSCGHLRLVTAAADNSIPDTAASITIRGRLLRSPVAGESITALG